MIDIDLRRFTIIQNRFWNDLKRLGWSEIRFMSWNLILMHPVLQNKSFVHVFFSLLSPKRWFHAEHSLDTLVAWARDIAVQPRWHALDIFGASQKVSSTWIKEGMRAVSFDIKISKGHDICTVGGCQELIRMGLEFLSWTWKLSNAFFSVWNLGSRPGGDKMGNFWLISINILYGSLWYAVQTCGTEVVPRWNSSVGPTLQFVWAGMCCGP